MPKPILELVETTSNASAFRRRVVAVNRGAKCILCGSAENIMNNFCYDCRRDSEQLSVPRENEFRDEKNRETDFLLSPELTRVGHKLIDNYTEEFGRLAEGAVEIDYFWKRKGGSSGGLSTLGKCIQVTGPLKFYSNKNYLIWIAADHCIHFKYYEFTALVFHELKHAYFNLAADKPELIGHDFEGFNSEIAIFGSWRPNARAMGEAFKLAEQPKLFE